MSSKMSGSRHLVSWCMMARLGRSLSSEIRIRDCLCVVFHVAGDSARSLLDNRRVLSFVKAAIQVLWLILK